MPLLKQRDGRIAVGGLFPFARFDLLRNGLRRRFDFRAPELLRPALRRGNGLIPGRGFGASTVAAIFGSLCKNGGCVSAFSPGLASGSDSSSSGLLI